MSDTAVLGSLGDLKQPAMLHIVNRIVFMVQVSDNSGAKVVQCIQKSGTQWTLGDIITVAVKKARGGKVCDVISTLPLLIYFSSAAFEKHMHARSFLF
jgi:hypothetical protein